VKIFSTLSRPDQKGIGIAEIDYRGLFNTTDTAFEKKIHPVLKYRLDVIRIVQVLLFREPRAGTDDGIAEPFQQTVTDGVIRYSDTD